MASDNQEKTRDTENPAPPYDSALIASTWLAPFSSGTLLSLQNAIGNRALSQLLQLDMEQHRRKDEGNGNGHKNNGKGHNVTDLQLSAIATTAAIPIIVDDDVLQLEPGQMRKTAFLDRLKTSVCGATAEVLQNTMWSAMGCPYVEGWFRHYAAQDSAHVERALRRFAPETARAQSANDFILIVTERVRLGLSQWVEMGEMTGEPEEFTSREMTEGTLQGGAFSRSGVRGALSTVASGISSAVATVGSVLVKAREFGR
jgi:hypothetical protein